MFIVPLQFSWTQLWPAVLSIGKFSIGSRDSILHHVVVEKVLVGERMKLKSSLVFHFTLNNWTRFSAEKLFYVEQEIWKKCLNFLSTGMISFQVDDLVYGRVSCNLKPSEEKSKLYKVKNSEMKFKSFF